MGDATSREEAIARGFEYWMERKPLAKAVRTIEMIEREIAEVSARIVTHKATVSAVKAGKSPPPDSQMFFVHNKCPACPAQCNMACRMLLVFIEAEGEHLATLQAERNVLNRTGRSVTLADFDLSAMEVGHA